MRGIKPIFHWKWGSRWVPNTNEIYTKNMKCTWPTPAFCVGTQRNLYSTDWRRGLASGMTQILELGNAKIYQHVGISNAKILALGALPNANPRRQVFCVAVEYRLKDLSRFTIEGCWRLLKLVGDVKNNNYNSCNVWHSLYLRSCIFNSFFAMNYLQWQLEIIFASCCMSYHWKAYGILRITMKTV